MAESNQDYSHDYNMLWAAVYQLFDKACVLKVGFNPHLEACSCC
jgi:hypothetical protein